MSKRIKKKLKKRTKSLFKQIKEKVLDKVVKYSTFVAILLLGFLGFYLVQVTGLLDKTIKYKDAPRAGTYRELLVHGKANVTIREIDKKTKEVISEKNYVTRNPRFTQDDEGVIEGKIRRLGLTFEPGYTAFVSQNRPHIGLDIQWFYWRRLGFSSGLGIRSALKQMDENDSDIEIGAYPIALNYNLPFKFTPNTNVFVGMDDQIKPMGGLSVKW